MIYIYIYIYIGSGYIRLIKIVIEVLQSSNLGNPQMGFKDGWTSEGLNFHKISLIWLEIPNLFSKTVIEVGLFLAF